MKFRHSIVTRFALFFTGLIVFAILITGYLVFQKASAVIINNSRDRIKHTSELAEQSFYSLLNEVSNDIGLISSNPTLLNFVNDPSEENKANLNGLFRATLQNKPDYFQIRLIGIENNGKEIIRFDKVNNRVKESEDLQNKGDHEYYQEAIKIKNGEFYFSKINLNEEYGTISEPHIPTVRAAKPIFNLNNEIIGIVIINVNLNRFYTNLMRISGDGSQLYIIDKDGQYLYSPIKSQTFGLQLNNQHNFFNEYNTNLEFFNADQRKFGELEGKNNKTYLSYTKGLTYFNEKRNIYLVSLMEEDILLNSARAVRSDSTKILLFICLFSIFLSWLFTNLFSKRINQVTKAISNYNKGEKDSVNLPIERKDEIGVLARAFTQMKATIDKQVNKLNKALKEEKLAKKERDEFLQNMSHEMRTPLNTILGLTDLLQKNNPDQSLAPVVNSLKRSSNNLAGLVYDVLDHQKLVKGKVLINYEPTNIGDLLNDIYSSYQFEAVQKGIKFNLKIDDKLNEQIYLTDDLRLTQIITNLVVNAIKYTKEGSINIAAKIVTEKDPQLKIIVKDTGIGILPENLNKINDRFFREKEDLSGRYGGYGLGLSIVKQLTALFKGELTAISKKNEGSEFSITIPLLKASQLKTENINNKNTNLTPTLSGNYQIVHIEDDLTTQELVKFVIKDNNIKLTQFNNFNKALEVIKTAKPDLVISDLMLEQSNLQSVLTSLLKSDKMDCPLLIVSALEPEQMKDISPLYFQKPFKIDNLKDMVYYLLGKHEYECPDFSNIYRNYDHDQQKISKVLSLLSSEFDMYLTRIEKAFKNKDQEEWKSILHKLVTHIHNLKLTGLSQLLPEEISSLKKEKLEQINNTFYYLCCFRVETYINSKD